ncbi:YjjG family noncanonical pyrimidine nucleotidase [bacterium]|nr:YjjG family noncanonical pyrimidine nucleotidase [bacterium]
MKTYELLLLDADETLFDFRRAEAFALEGAFAERGLAATPEAVARYDAINKDIWRRLERGEIDQATLKVERFALLFAEMGVALDAADFSDLYLAWLGRGSFLLPGAEELCAYLAAKYRLAIVTNGIAAVQRPRFEVSPIRRHFEAIVISEEVGAAKPHPAIFERACEALGVFDKSKVLMIGDSLSSDIAGGAAYGVDTCWLNPGGAPAAGPAGGRAPSAVGGFAPTYVVRDLAELRALL